MSLYNLRMPSLKDKLQGQEKAEKVELPKEKVEPKEKVIKGRRLNK